MLDDSAHRPETGKRRVLIVDDDMAFAQSLGAVLEQSGYEARVAFDAAQALALTAEYRPQVVIADLHMPVVDGYALLAIFRADATLSACTFIGISGDALELARAAEAFDCFLVKPLAMSVLIGALEQPRQLPARH